MVKGMGGGGGAHLAAHLSRVALSRAEALPNEHVFSLLVSCKCSHHPESKLDSERPPHNAVPRAPLASSFA